MAIRYYTLGMKSLSQAAAFDTAIANAALRINTLLTGNPDQAELEALQTELAALIRNRRDHLYTLVDARAIVSQVFDEHFSETRRQKAAELEGQVLSLIEQYHQEADGTKENLRSEYDLLVDTLAFLRFFKHDDPPTPETDAPAPRLIWTGKHGLTRQAFVEALQTAKFISLENASLLAATLEDYKAEKKAQRPKVDWDGSKESLVSFLTMSFNLGILNPDTILVRNRDIVEDAEGVINALIPPIADIIASRFTIQGRNVSHSDISREANKKAEAGIDKITVLELINLKDHLQGLAEVNGFKRTDQSFDWDDMLYSFFRLYDDGKKDLDFLIDEIQCLDLGVLRILNDLHNEHYLDRQGLSEDLARL